MGKKSARPTFGNKEITIVNNAVAMAEELVSNHFKMSASQWLRPKYDVETLTDLTDEEIVDGPFAQIIRYEGKLKGGVLGSSAYDFYKICIQDHAILSTLRMHPEMALSPFALYVVTHELVHIVRFSRFLQNFKASDNEKLDEERRVHAITHDILIPVNIQGLDAVLDFYSTWRPPLDGLKTIP
ncbi:hypothetical protein DSCA_63280 [Desulfosarcina alkanivorans]|uniref:Uncharacterized protein n=1 Tax=Desulfosarcina alkanivorans TaxID=571177 RepID=A0A5K7YUR3_9BACT|nr:hypothetical protein [Desulfosarcina alkanivorans]BBO72398.1 hypothetical protein DSCA_63280 [Desulfosarcina alkanivorans]